MLKLEFESAPGVEQHQCVSIRQGEWVIYRCPQCDYEMRENWQTGEVRVFNAKRRVRHSGGYTPVDFRPEYESLN